MGFNFGPSVVFVTDIQTCSADVNVNACVSFVMLVFAIAECGQNIWTGRRGVHRPYRLLCSTGHGCVYQRRWFTGVLFRVRWALMDWQRKVSISGGVCNDGVRYAARGGLKIFASSAKTSVPPSLTPGPCASAGL